MTPALATAFTNQNGSLKIENIKVNRQDSFSFIIEVVYASAIRLYVNQTRALEAGIVSKSVKSMDNSYNQMPQFWELLFQRFSNAFPILQ